MTVRHVSMAVAAVVAYEFGVFIALHIAPVAAQCVPL